MLVSHWAVNSMSTLALITSAFKSVEADRKLDQAVALQRGMLDFLSKAKGSVAHPYFWSAFIVVGVGL